MNSMVCSLQITQQNGVDVNENGPPKVELVESGSIVTPIDIVSKDSVVSKNIEL